MKFQIQNIHSPLTSPVLTSLDIKDPGFISYNKEVEVVEPMEDETWCLVDCVL